MLFISSDNLPDRLYAATEEKSSVLADIISNIASTCVKSILPPRKALFVNSPFSAIRAPCSIHISRIFCVTLSPPWHCISVKSSVV